MFSDKLLQEIRYLEYEMNKLKKRVDCLSGFHQWIVEPDMSIRCAFCNKNGEKGAEAQKTNNGMR